MFDWLLKEGDDDLVETAKDTGCLMLGIDRNMARGIFGRDDDHDEFMRNLQNRRRQTELEIQKALAEIAREDCSKTNQPTNSYVNSPLIRKTKPANNAEVKDYASECDRDY